MSQMMLKAHLAIGFAVLAISPSAFADRRAYGVTYELAGGIEV